MREHNAKAALYSGATVLRVHRETQEKYEAAVKFALGMLRQAQRATGLIRQVTEATLLTEATLREFLETSVE